MTKKERIQAAIRGEKPDKMPYSFWTHMPGTDLDPEAISQKTYEFYKKYDFDFVKTMNNGMYAIEDFGCTVDYSEIVKGGVAKVVSFIDHGAAVTTSRYDVDYVVTEQGIAQLKRKTLRERARELIGVAHPDARPELIEEYERRFHCKF